MFSQNLAPAATPPASRPSSQRAGPLQPRLLPRPSCCAGATASRPASPKSWAAAAVSLSVCAHRLAQVHAEMVVGDNGLHLFALKFTADPRIQRVMAIVASRVSHRLLRLPPLPPLPHPFPMVLVSEKFEILSSLLGIRALFIISACTYSS